MLYTTTYLIQALQIQRIIGVHSFKLFIRVDIGLDELLNKTTELVLALVHDHVRSPDDQLRVTLSLASTLVSRVL